MPTFLVSATCTAKLLCGMQKGFVRVSCVAAAPFVVALWQAYLVHQHSHALHSIAQHSTAQHSIAHHGPAQPGPAPAPALSHPGLTCPTGV